MYERITSDPHILGGIPAVCGTRLSVKAILEWLASGAIRDDILRRLSHRSPAEIEQDLASPVINERDRPRPL